MVGMQKNHRVWLSLMLVISSVLFSLSQVFPTQAATFTVTNTNNSGAGSLRQAIIDANSSVGADTIDFDPAVFGTTQTIDLTTGELIVTSEITFQGPPANVIVNQTTANHRVMRMDDGPVTMTNMTIQGGNLDANGSGILINNNSANPIQYRFGAGVVIQKNFGPLSGLNSFGGGIAAFNKAQIYLENGMQLINNTARTGAGIFLNFESDLFIDTATISGNTASVQGGGIRISGTGGLA